MKFDTERVLTVFKPYQAFLMEHIWKVNAKTRKGTTSGQAFENLQKTGNEDLMMSRTSAIIFLNDMAEEGVIEYEEKSGRGGFHKVYYPKMTRDEFGQYVVSARAQNTFISTRGFE